VGSNPTSGTSSEIEMRFKEYTEGKNYASDAEKRKNSISTQKWTREKFKEEVLKLYPKAKVAKYSGDAWHASMKIDGVEYSLGGHGFISPPSNKLFTKPYNLTTNQFDLEKW
jgi:hypothetical protein